MRSFRLLLPWSLDEGGCLPVRGSADASRARARSPPWPLISRFRRPSGRESYRRPGPSRAAT